MTTPPLPPASPATRYAGLDGLRAIAVGLVVIYHLFPGTLLAGGFVGVDVFFVISGFLITSLLLREHRATGRISLGDFWRRRARRLLPALALVVTVCASAAWMIGGDVLVRLGAQVIGAFTFSYNWISVAGGTGYFSAATPELFRNFWSLAVEEQFYVVWPLVLPLFLLLPRAWARVGAALALAVASAAWMGVLVASGGDLTRAYFGTDSHAFGIFLGVGLAFGIAPLRRRLSVGAVPVWMRSGAVRTTAVVIGSVGLLGILLIASLPPADTTATFPGALAAASIGAALVTLAGVWPGSPLGRHLDARPLRWVGERSYGIYLWHWPLLVLLVAAMEGTGPDAGVPVGIGLLTLALTLVLSGLSYRFVESPVRRVGFRGSLRRIGMALRARSGRRVTALAGLAAGAALVAGTAAAVVAGPAVSSGQSVVEAGAAALAAETASPSPTDPSATAGDADQEAAPEETPDTGAAPTPSPTPVTGEEITAVGDSVMLASAPSLLERFPGISVDAAESRSAWAGPGILRTLRDEGRLRPVVVVGLGTNGPVDRATLEEIADIAGPDRRVVLVNAFAPRDWVPGVNDTLRTFAAAHSGVSVADWSAAIDPHRELLAGDRIHPGHRGGDVYADAVAAGVERAEYERAVRRYGEELRAFRDENSHGPPLVPQ
ncbi:acyltransferase family protein [Microbacterium sp. SSW1-59]|uniref:acyltransferase family protein n=1 Tax=Microbacterium xanthum TaxID=3079794 RepID=UPI002AD557D3|nr:acyltransferase family protein [Microbacterium sp. SSW1-59]MDZ8201153.1 acyltransferase family protein [Microbacterium sp. SSW1-59]